MFRTRMAVAFQKESDFALYDASGACSVPSAVAAQESVGEPAGMLL